VLSIEPVGTRDVSIRKVLINNAAIAAKNKFFRKSKNRLNGVLIAFKVFSFFSVLSDIKSPLNQ
jgi:hypothetical protein